MDFDFKQGMERLMKRCPDLGDRIAVYLSQGSASEVTKLVGELLTRPNLTVVVASCFRPMLLEVVTDLVHSMEGLGSSGHRATREYVSMALSRILELAPFLLSSILQYFAFAPPPFERLFHDNSSSDAPSLLEIVRASYRFLQLEPKSFRELWDWSPFLGLLQWTGTENVSDIRWCAVQILSSVFSMSDAATRELSSSISELSEEEGFACLIRWHEFCHEIAVEKPGMYTSNELWPLTDSSFQSLTVADLNSLVKWKRQANGSVSHVSVCGVELPVRPGFSGSQVFESSLVVTPTVKSQLQGAALALSQRQPVLLEGPLGSGKSSLIWELARLTGNQDILFIHLDDQVDVKVLLGNYVCTEIPGEFKWQPGTLAQAMERGLWVVFEDIDRAPSELSSSLVSLLEDRRLLVPGRGETIHASENFRLLATVSRTKFGSIWKSGEGRDSFSYLWRKVVVEAPSDDELMQILDKRFPGLQTFNAKLIGVLSLMKDIASQSSAYINSAGGVSINIGRHFSLRDLIKLCIRIARSADAIITQTEVLRDQIYLEAVDCFAASVRNSADRQLVMRAIAEHFGVPLDLSEFYNSYFKPACQELPSGLQIGRAFLPSQSGKAKVRKSIFADTGHTMRSLESISRCVENREPVLLVGETGTGKTTSVQILAQHTLNTLTVVNLSQQSDATDLLGGCKPVEARTVCLPLLEIFNQLFVATFSLQKNKEFWETVQRYAEKKRWVQLLKAFRGAVTKVGRLVKGNDGKEPGSKRLKPLSQELLDKWCAFSVELKKTEKQVEASKSAFAFTFVEGALVKALRDGSWILLDEINLAPPEILERLNGVFDGTGGSICLTERGDLEIVERHPNFRIFACMNPATDVGKRELPAVLRNRLTEIFVDEMVGKEDLETLVFKSLEGAMPSPPAVEIVNFYLKAREEAEKRLLDGAGHKPQYSLRSLSRSLEYTRHALPTYGFQRSLYDGVCMSFLTLLDQSSRPVMEQVVERVLFKQSAGLAKMFVKPPAQPSEDHVLFEQFWIQRGAEKLSASDMEFCKRYVLTKTIKEHLKNVARAVYIRKYPVLLQGPTSSGKTSLVRYLASVTGHKFVRINNHEHTDIQEYLGSYVSDHSGKLVFQEGLLVEAVRNGYWVVLDELNLAPSDVLEALNRLLDDNRELFLPELQVSIKPHPHFMLFATQNPPGIYGGRKVLSRAFRNRFIEVHVDDIPSEELVTILEKRCEVPASYAGKMVEVMKDLQRHRQVSKVFAGKHGFITPRDLFRWAERHRKSGISYDDLAWSGYVLLAERVRDGNEKLVVQRSLEKNLRVKVDPDRFQQIFGTTKLEQNGISCTSEHFGRIVWTKAMKRLFYLAEQCHEHNEPLLFVGETGCGKTTVCQLLAMSLGQKLHILNCHQHTETSDFLGGFRPMRGKENIVLKYQDGVNKLNAMKYFSTSVLSPKLEEFNETMDIVKRILKSQEATADAKGSSLLQTTVEKLQSLYKEWQSLFVWHDGPLVTAMRDGDLLLVDEISLADDSVIERLNSVLEPKGSLVLAEKGGSHVEEVFPHPDFRIMATMNPGGDFGKKELSPALRNRFTEVWVPPISDLDDLRRVIQERLSRQELQCLVEPLIQFWEWFRLRQEISRLLSVRDLLAWINYLNAAANDIGIYAALVHGAFLVLLDGLGLGSGVSFEASRDSKYKCIQFLMTLVPEEFKVEAERACAMDSHSRIEIDKTPSKLFGVHPFYISRGGSATESIKFEFRAPTTSRNVMRILRAMQLRKPVLLEGSPGVGKTSLVSALAAASGHTVVRINLSEQTDILDLFGSDLPVEGGKAGEFQWSDGVFLQALKAGHWVLLDELNLASQSVLEGLNSCLDHRGEIFIPELGLVFKCPSTFRLFACQNPSHEGGGRKGLPKSFLNRFTRVYAEPLSSDDHIFIASALHPGIPHDLLLKMIHFNSELNHEIMVMHLYGQSGAPWEFNLRDILRWCSLVDGASSQFNFRSKLHVLSYYVHVVYLQRLRSLEDRKAASDLFTRVFGTSPSDACYPSVGVTGDYVGIGWARLTRKQHHCAPPDNVDKLQLLPGSGNILESTMHCIGKGWMCILVGPPKSGKTSTVRTLASLTGNTLYEYNLSGSTDTTELLGCFEQRDTMRCLRAAFVAGRYATEAVCSFCLSRAADERFTTDRRIAVVKSILASWSTLKKVQGNNVGESDSAFVALLKQLLESLELAVAAAGTGLYLGLGRFRQLVSNLNVEEEGNAGRFEWIDGDLLRAVELGDWILLENANLCNPTVLDRLNSLLEPAGTLMINERGLVNGRAMSVKAHPDFRLFLTVDPANGEVSRAMRNRGVEIYMIKNDSAAEEDTRSLIRSSGVSGLPLIETMSKVHEEVKSLLQKSHSSTITLRELRQWLSLLKLLLERGDSFQWSMMYSWEQAYLTCIAAAELQTAARNIFRGHVCSLELAYDVSFYVPIGWPSPLTIREYCMRSKEAIIRRDCSYLSHLAFRLLTVEIATQAQSRRGDILQWLVGIRNVSVHFPQKLLQFMHFPHERLDIPEINIDIGGMEKMLEFTITWVLEQAPFLDLELRTQRIRDCIANVKSKLPWTGNFPKVLQLEKRHPTFIQLSATWRLFRQMISSAQTESQLDFVSWTQLRDEESFSELEPDVKVVWMRLTFLAGQLMDLRRSLLQQVAEDEYFQTEATNLRGSASPVMQSYRHHKQAVLKFSPCERVFIWLYPTLLFLRKLENDVLLLPVSEFPADLLSELLDWHEAFWQAIKHPIKNLENLQFIWLRLQRCISEFGSKVVVVDDHRNLLRSMDAAVVPSSAKPYLWKFAGHPQLPQSMELRSYEKKFSDVCKRAWEEGQTDECNILLRSDSQLWWLLLEGLSILSCMGRSRGIYDLQAFEEMMKVVSNKMNSEEANLLVPATNFRTSCSDGCNKLQTYSRELLLQPFGRELWHQMMPLFHHLSLLLHSSIITDLLPSVAEFTYNGDAIALFNRTANHAKDFHHAISFAMKVMSSSPEHFVGLQNIAWIIDVDPSSISGPCIRDYIHEAIYHWHSALWDDLKHGTSILGAWQRFQATETSLFSRYTSSFVQIKDYNAKLHQLETGLNWAWFSLRQSIGDSFKSDLCFLSAAIQQVIFSYKKLFPQVDSIFSTFSTLHRHLLEMTVEAENIEELRTLLLYSMHPAVEKVIHELVLPCIGLLYLTYWDQLANYEAFQKLGQVWILVGRMRLELLIAGYGVDPMAKHLYKHAHVIGKLEDINTEIEVRRECNRFAKGGESNVDVKSLMVKKKTMEEESQKLKLKVVPRPSPSQFGDFYSDAIQFMHSFGSPSRINVFVEALTLGVDTEIVAVELGAWQENAMSFIRQLSSRFSAYRDVAQPFQLGIYELKYGLSVLSGAHASAHVFGKDDNMDLLINLVISLMCFPSFDVTSANPMCISGRLSDHQAEKLIERAISCSATSVSQDMEVKLKVSVLLIALQRLSQEYIHSRIFNAECMKLLHNILNSIVSIWKRIRSLQKAREDEDAQQIRFKKLDNEADEEEASFKELFPSHWTVEAMDEITDGHELQKLVPDMNTTTTTFSNASVASLLEEMLSVFPLLLRIFPTDKNTSFVKDEDRIEAFTFSYDSGRTIFEGISHGIPKSVDKLLFPAHLFKMSLECASLSRINENDVNVYKDAQPAELSRMLDPLTALVKKINVLLEEWPEHPVLVQVLQFVDSVLSIPLSSTVIKALSGLELVLAKAQIWEQNAPKHLSLSDALSNVSMVIMRWRRMELQSWPVLFNDVSYQHEANAKRLWFSFYDLLHNVDASQLDALVESSEELLLSSPIGEFQTRLKLIGAFYSEFDMCDRVSPSPIRAGVKAVMFNMLSYYSRFLPVVLEALTSGKDPLEKELTDFIRLSKWEDLSYYSVVSTAERSHRKIHKILRKHNEFLKRPVMEICRSRRRPRHDHENEENEEDNESRRKETAFERTWSDFCSETITSIVTIPSVQPPREIEQKMINTARKLGELLGSYIFENQACEMRQIGTLTLEDFATAIVHRSAELRQESKSRALKKKALHDLRKGLRELGLSHYKTDIPKHLRGSKSWFQEPPVNLDKLVYYAQAQDNLQMPAFTDAITSWNRAKDYYFDNIALLQDMYRNSLDYHKDLSLAEVDVFTRYMEHTLYLQQKQRRKIHEFASYLTGFFKLTSELQKLGSETSLPSESLGREFLSQQKSLFDRLCEVAAEVQLFCGTIIKAGNASASDANSLISRLSADFVRLRARKALLDELLVPFEGFEEAGVPCPMVVTGKTLAMVEENFVVVQEMKQLVDRLTAEMRNKDGAGIFVLLPMQKVLLQGVHMAEQFYAPGTPFPTTENELSSISARYEDVVKQIRLAGQRLQGVRSTFDALQAEKTLRNFEAYLEESMEALRLGQIYKSSVDALGYMAKMLDEGNLTSEIGLLHVSFLRSLSLMLKMHAAAGMQVFCDYLFMHKSVAKLEYIVLNVLNDLLRDGFCGAREEEEQESSGKFQEAEGTGMGEGEGTKDVSEQIEDEEQLLGNSEDGAPSDDKKDDMTAKGVEMQQDFSGDMVDISEDEQDGEEEESEDEGKLESQMGQGDENQEVVDEKLWDKEDDDMDQQGTEKLEQGKALPDTGFDDLEMRAKDQQTEDTEETSEKETPAPQNESVSAEPHGNEENREEDAVEDPTGVKPSQPTQDVEEASMEDRMLDDNEPVEEEPNKDQSGDMPAEEPTKQLPVDMEIDADMKMEEDDTPEDETKDKTGQHNEQPREVGDEEDCNEKVDTTEQKADGHQGEEAGELMDEAGPQLDEQTGDNRNTVVTYGVASSAAGNPLSDDVDDTRENTSGDKSEQEKAMQSTVPNNAGSYAPSAREMTTERENRLEANPYRSLGDALKKWKQKAKMVGDQEEEAPEKQPDDQTEHDNEDAYKYTVNDEQSNAQAMGAATDDQLKLCDDLGKVLEENEDVGEEKMSLDEAPTVQEAELISAEQVELDDKMEASTTRTTLREPTAGAETEESEPEIAVQDAVMTETDGSLVRFDRLQQDNRWTSSLNSEEEAQSLRMGLETQMQIGVRDVENARKIWQTFEQLTGRLSQDLAEQLRLILEPTLASRLQGDYKSGKRLNMKKIIPFVASEFRKDKIWLRRTKPNKRQYQVVIALDDSRSMSESHCGPMALEALITICRGMTQLEVGQMAVASFGKKGNVRLLHDFEQSFSSEAGVKIVSEFSFRQDNTITDEPMVDLLQYLTKFLNVVATQYAPSGQRDLQQLVLIIADGRFHEKESLRRCVRDALSRKQLLAFLVLDNPKESLLDMQSVSFSTGAPTFTKYLDTFPFPYYLVLKDIGALPRTLADLLRQWFELMQHTATV